MMAFFLGGMYARQVESKMAIASYVRRISIGEEVEVEARSYSGAATFAPGLFIAIRLSEE